jgi:hypothetical protein
MSEFSAIEKRTPTRISEPVPDQIHILDGDATWTGFKSIIEAVIFREKTLDRSSLITAPDDDQEAAMLLFGSSVRDLLAKLWRDEQYERMYRGDEFSLTDGVSRGVSNASTLIMAEILGEAHGSAWSARSGRVSHRDGRSVDHAWMRHDSGTILDISSDLFIMSPIVFFHEDDPTIWSYVDEGPVDAPDARNMAEKWRREISPDMLEISRVRSRMIRPDASPDIVDIPAV